MPVLLSRWMITGFNTDVQHGGRVYHVQTEDRGQEHPFFESLVYVGGTIVAKKRTPYSEQVDQGATEEAIAQLLRRQHQVVIAAIKAGRIEELIRHTAVEGKIGEIENQAQSAKAASPEAKIAHATTAPVSPPNGVSPAPIAPNFAAPSEAPAPLAAIDAGPSDSNRTEGIQPSGRNFGSRPL